MMWTFLFEADLGGICEPSGNEQTEMRTRRKADVPADQRARVRRGDLATANEAHIAPATQPQSRQPLSVQWTARQIMQMLTSTQSWPVPRKLLQVAM